MCRTSPPTPSRISQDADWKIFPLIAYGIRSQPNIDLCPQTWRVVQGIPGLTTAMFSILEPGKRLPPHRGPYNGVLRLHLGLLVPEPRERAAIRVGPRATPLAGRSRADLRRRLRARSVERDRARARRAVRRLRKAAALSGQCPSTVCCSLWHRSPRFFEKAQTTCGAGSVASMALRPRALGADDRAGRMAAFAASAAASSMKFPGRR